MTKRNAGPFAAAVLPGDDEEGADKGSNGDADDNVVLGEHCAGFWLVFGCIVGCCSGGNWEKVSSSRMRHVAGRMHGPEKTMSFSG